MQSQDNLEIPGGNTRRQIKLEVELGYCSIEDKCLNLHRTWYLKENMVRTTIAKKGQISDIRWTYTKGIIDFKRSFDEKMYIVSMGMNAKFKVDSHFSNAQPFIHFSRSMKL